MHLRLPVGDTGPTLEIFNYSVAGSTTAVNSPGFGHIAFAVDDVPAAWPVLAAGGRAVGEVVTVPSFRRASHWCYVADPENVIELQAWS
jgi:hypothetical protein